MWYGCYVFNQVHAQSGALQRPQRRLSSASRAFDQDVHGPHAVLLGAAGGLGGRLLGGEGSAFPRSLEPYYAGAHAGDGVAFHVRYGDYGVVKGTLNVNNTFLHVFFNFLFSSFSFSCHVSALLSFFAFKEQSGHFLIIISA
jgi:hypothetical protein